MSEHAAGGEAEVQRKAAVAMAAERATAAEMMAPTAAVVMEGAVLVLRRDGGGSGWRHGFSKRASFELSRAGFELSRQVPAEARARYWSFRFYSTKPGN